MGTCGVTLSGQLTSAPLSNTGTNGGLPTATSTLDLALSSGTQPRGQQCQTGAATRYVEQAAGTYEDLDAVGPGTAVPKGEVLVMRTTVAMQVRLTTYLAAGNVVSVIPLKGQLVLEFDPDRHLLLLEASGQGDIEYFVSGRRA